MRWSHQCKKNKFCPPFSGDLIKVNPPNVMWLKTPASVHVQSLQSVHSGWKYWCINSWEESRLATTCEINHCSHFFLVNFIVFSFVHPKAADWCGDMKHLKLMILKSEAWGGRFDFYITLLLSWANYFHNSSLSFNNFRQENICCQLVWNEFCF